MTSPSRATALNNLNYTLGGTGAVLPVGSSAVGDIAEGLSLVNRRFYSQMKVYYAKFSLMTWQGANPNDYIDLGLLVAPNTYVTRQAWKLGHKKYNEAMREERKLNREMYGRHQSRWHDFRIGLDVSHTVDAAGSWETMMPVLAGTSGTDATVGAVSRADLLATGRVEWPGANVKSSGTEDDADASAYYYRMFGDTVHNPGGAGFYGLVDEWDDGGNVEIDTPRQTGEVPYEEIIADVDHSNVERLLSFGDNPPYDGDAAQQGLVAYNLCAQGQTSTVPGLQIYSTPFIPVPCGLFKIYNSGGNDFSEWDTAAGAYNPQVTVNVELAAGDYMGVMAHNMG